MNKNCMSSGVKMSGISLLITWSTRQTGLYGNISPYSAVCLLFKTFLIKKKKNPCHSIAIIMALNTGCSVHGQLSDISWQRTGTQEGGTWRVTGQPWLSQWAKTSLIGNNFHQNWGIPLGSPLKHHHFRIRLLQRKFFSGGFQDSAMDPCLCSPEFPYLWMGPHCKLSWKRSAFPYMCGGISVMLNACLIWHLCWLQGNIQTP